MKAEKGWGGYEISGLKFKSIDLTPDQLTLDVKRSVEVSITKARAPGRVAHLAGEAFQPVSAR